MFLQKKTNMSIQEFCQLQREEITIKDIRENRRLEEMIASDSEVSKLGAFIVAVSSIILLSKLYSYNGVALASSRATIEGAVAATATAVAAPGITAGVALNTVTSTAVTIMPFVVSNLILNGQGIIVAIAIVYAILKMLGAKNGEERTNILVSTAVSIALIVVAPFIFKGVGLVVGRIGRPIGL